MKGWTWADTFALAVVLGALILILVGIFGVIGLQVVLTAHIVLLCIVVIGALIGASID